MKHNIYLLEPTQEGWNRMPTYDVYCGHVVIADNKAEARKSCEYADEGDIWISPRHTTCTKIGETNKPKRVVLSGFHAG